MKASRNLLAKIMLKRWSAAGEPELAKELAAYLLSENRVGELDSLLRDIMQLRADQGTVEVLAVSARPLAVQTRQDIESVIKKVYPRAHQVIVSEEYDPSLIGGVRLELANQQLDLTIRSKLNKFKQLTA